jgi:hypothetical protein
MAWRHYTHEEVDVVLGCQGYSCARPLFDQRSDCAGGGIPDCGVRSYCCAQLVAGSTEKPEVVFS